MSLNAEEKQREFLQQVKTQLESVPIRNEAIEIEERDSGRIYLISVTLKYHGISRLLTRVLKAGRKKRYQLDGVSLALFKKIDGKRMIGDLLDGMMQEHKLTFVEARGLVLQYLHVMVAKGIVVVAGWNSITVS